MTNPIQSRIHHLLPNHTITTIQPVSKARHHTVWKVTTQTGQTFAAKHHLFAPLTRGKPFDLLAVEQKVTTLLQTHGVPVAPIVAADPDHGLVITSWQGDRTLDDHCQTHDPAPIADGVINALLALETGFQHHTDELAPHIAPGCSAADFKTGWLQQTGALANSLPDLAAHLTGRPPDAALSAHWTALIHHLAECPPTLGPTDYNARNIVLDPAGAPCVLELAKIGFDWPQRRLVQYTTSLGATHPEGRIIGLLTPTRAARYAHRAAHLYRRPANTLLTVLDGHHFVFHTLIAVTCLQADADHPWQNRQTRLQDAHTQLIAPLSDHAHLAPLRAAFQT